MKYRIAMWASPGFLVAACWALYFATRGKDNPIEPILSALGFLTQPIVLIGSYFHFGMSFYLVILANTATYALVGLIVEALRRRLHHAYPRDCQLTKSDEMRRPVPGGMRYAPKLSTCSKHR